MSRARLSLVLVLALSLVACAVGRSTPPTATYMIETPPPELSMPRCPERLSLGRISVVPAFAGRALVYRLDEARYAADFYNALIADPADLLGPAIATWLDRAGPFASVTQPGGHRGATLVLEVVVTELYGDFRRGAAAAVVSAQFRLIDLTGVRPTLRMERTLGRRLDLADASPDALVRGYGLALREILSELAAVLTRSV